MIMLISNDAMLRNIWCILVTLIIYYDKFIYGYVNFVGYIGITSGGKQIHEESN